MSFADPEQFRVAMRTINPGLSDRDIDEAFHILDRFFDDWQDRAAVQPNVVLTNPWTGEPRDIRDVESDPQGTLIVEPGAPLRALQDEPPCPDCGSVNGGPSGCDDCGYPPGGYKLRATVKSTAPTNPR